MLDIKLLRITHWILSLGFMLCGLYTYGQAPGCDQAKGM